ncbi:thioesterase II family protein [Kitasatospora sp. NPDC008050]|uniref:thioesterase II family protein n=1 Tax=Kitasatospora sp. NPDC008050 TaxID=3364021 RepID=UPI0036E0DD46
MIRFQPPPPASGPAVLLIPGIGGTARSARPLTQALGGLPVSVALRRPGAAGESGQAPSIPSRAQALARQLAEGLCPGELVVVGHSLGGYIALELVRELALLRPGAVCALVVAGQLPSHRQPCHADDGFADETLLGKVTGGTLPEGLAAEPELLRRLVDQWRGDYQAIDAYAAAEAARPRAPLAVPLHVWNATGDPAAPSGAALGAWREYTSAPTAFAVFEGGHDFLFTRAESAAARLRQLVPRQATFAPSRRPARTLAAPAESPSTSSTRASGRHADSTHRTPLLDGQKLPDAALGSVRPILPGGHSPVAPRTEVLHV